MKRRGISVLLVLCLLITLLPAFTAAEGTDVIVTSEAELLAAYASQSAVNSITISGTVTLTGDCRLPVDDESSPLLHTTLCIDKDATLNVAEGASFGIPWMRPDDCTAKLIVDGTMNVYVKESDEGGFKTFGNDGRNNGVMNVYGFVSAGFENEGEIFVKAGGTLATTMGGNIHNTGDGVITIEAGEAEDNSDAGTLITWMGGELKNDGLLVMNGILRPEGASYDSDDDGVNEFHLFFDEASGTISCTTDKPTYIYLEEERKGDIPADLVAHLQELFPKATVTLTTVKGYWVTLTGGDGDAAVGNTITITVLIEGDSTEDTLTWNALDLLLTFNAEMLRLDTTALAGYTLEGGEGTVRITRSGEAVTSGTEPFTLEFTIIGFGETDVWPMQGGHAYVAKGEGITADTLAANTATDTFIVAYAYAVTLGSDFSGEDRVADAEAYSFEAIDKNYTYIPSVTIGGESGAYTETEDGCFTIAAEAINGPIVIGTAQKTPKSYSVTFDGSASADAVGADTASYLSDYHFSVNAAVGYAYETPLVTIGGAAYTDFTADENGYTISGEDITGAIVITLEKTVYEGVNTLLGDANENAVTNSADAAVILRYTVKLDTLSAQGLLNADVNLDKKVTAADAAAILRYTVKLDTLPPAV